MKLFPTRPMRLPRLRPYVPRADDPAIFWFNGERDDIVKEVTTRVVAANSADNAALEYALNEVAFYEAQRLARQKDQEAKDSLGFWKGVLKRVARMSEEEKRRTLSKIVRRMAKDVAGNFDPRVYRMSETVVPRLLTAVMNPMSLPQELVRPHSRIDELLRVEGDVEKLQKLSQKGTLIFTPTHSSNLDSIVLGYALQMNGLPPVIYGAGKNLFTNPIISFFMHNLGAYRVDRRVKSRLYKAVLKTYSTVMIERGYHSLFFPGGTRSRSGLIERKLKLGLAGTGVEAYSRNQVKGVRRKVWFVPTTINYVLVLEAETLIEDYLKEQGKARYIIDDDEFSRIDRWVSFFRKLTSMESPCVIRFGAPLDPFGNDVDDNGKSVSPRGAVVDSASYVSRDGKASIDPARDRAYTEDLGNVLSGRYCSESIIMTTQLVAHVLYRRLVHATPGLEEFVRTRHRGDVTIPREELVRELGDARDALARLENQGQVRMSEMLRKENPDYVLEQALEAFKGYHSRVAAHDIGAEVSVEDPTLLLFYQNRLVPYAETLADDVHLRAAREIARIGTVR
ncbi:MAG: 1-acyl-sn-glycerol-3-phosphate acyltransferase [Myxococcota bacterium]